MYYNTTNEKGQTLKENWAHVNKQEQLVLAVFKLWPFQSSMTPFEVQFYLQQYPITSIRRAITDLTNAGLLEKTSEKGIGPYGKPSYKWKLK